MTAGAAVAASERERSAGALGGLARAMGKTGAGSIGSGLLAALATKIVAVVCGPAAVAMLSTWQQIAAAGVTAATMNGQTALVQGASSLGGAQRREYVGAVLRLFAIATMVVAAAMWTAPRMIASWAGLTGIAAELVRWLAIPVAFSSVFTFAASLVRSIAAGSKEGGDTGEIGTLAKIQVAAALAGAVVAWPAALAARAGHKGALIGMLVCSAGAAAVGAMMAIYKRREIVREWFKTSGESFVAGRLGSKAGGVRRLGEECAGVLRGEHFGVPVAPSTAGALRHFFSISGAMLGTSLLASAVLLGVRGNIARVSGGGVLGEFDAAWGISMNHVTLMLAAMQVYYLPVLAAAGDAGERRAQIVSGFRLVTVVAAAIIVAIAIAKPAILGLLYSAAFRPAARYLRWTLAGDYLKATSWVLAIPMLASAHMGAFVAADIATQAAFWGGAWVLRRFREPAEAAAIAFAISYAANFAVCYAYARGRHGFRLKGATGAMWLGGLALVSAVSLGVAGV